MRRMVFEPGRGQIVPVWVWARSISVETERQLERLASQPYVVERVCAMADAHVSEGVAVGSVFATERTVVPRALGGDLGCGMSAIQLEADARALDRRRLDELIRVLGRAIPAGDATHRGRGLPVPEGLLSTPLSTRALEHAREALARRHLGTLGGGNHFLELDRDAEEGLWLLVHSGSRGLGAAVAAHHARIAGHDGKDALGGLDAEASSGADYLRDLEWAADFARANRQALAKRALEVLADVTGIDIEPGQTIDVPHNFVARERWFGRDLLVHRKGAVAAPRGGLALVPGSMATASYIVEGLGSEDAFGSCSHGAGRVMTRREARAAIRPAALAEAMRRIAYPEHRARDLVEEAPAAYRDIADVLADQSDLVRRRVRLEPIAVLKG